jgi:hypothetical protein
MLTSFLRHLEDSRGNRNRPLLADADSALDLGAAGSVTLTLRC